MTTEQIKELFDTDKEYTDYMDITYNMYLNILRPGVKKKLPIDTDDDDMAYIQNMTAYKRAVMGIVEFNQSSYPKEKGIRVAIDNNFLPTVVWTEKFEG